MTKPHHQHLHWARDATKFTWRGDQIQAPKALLHAVALPQDEAVAVVTMFDENTPHDEPNAWIFRPSSGFEAINITEEGALVRVLGVYVEGGILIFNAVNSFEYLVDAHTSSIMSRRYYR